LEHLELKPMLLCGVIEYLVGFPVTRKKLDLEWPWDVILH